MLTVLSDYPSEYRLEHFELRVAADADYQWGTDPDIQKFQMCLAYHGRFPGGQTKTFLCDQPVYGRWLLSEFLYPSVTVQTSDQEY